MPVYGTLCPSSAPPAAMPQHVENRPHYKKRDKTAENARCIAEPMLSVCAHKIEAEPEFSISIF